MQTRKPGEGGGGGESLRPHPGGKSGLGPLPGRGRPASCSGSGSRTARGRDWAAFPWGIPLRSLPSPPPPDTHTRARVGKLRLGKKDCSPEGMGAGVGAELRKRGGFREPRPQRAPWLPGGWRQSLGIPESSAGSVPRPVAFLGFSSPLRAEGPEPPSSPRSCFGEGGETAAPHRHTRSAQELVRTGMRVWKGVARPAPQLSRTHFFWPSLGPFPFAAEPA